MVTGGRRWDSLTADTDAVTLGRRSLGVDGGPQSLADSVARFCGSRAHRARERDKPMGGPSHSPTASASSPPNVVSSCLTISACFFSLRVTLAANTAAEATMIARGT